MSPSLIFGDCLEAMRELGPESIDTIVTDPPYGLRFMGKRWDYDVPSVGVWAEALRVLKDGGRLLCFAGARTAHRMTVNIEDAGFVIEDVVMWIYGSGFPKHRSKLKPAYEPIVVARKGSVSDLNIDAGRIPTDSPRPLMKGPPKDGEDGGRFRSQGGYYVGDTTEGRWPANVALDEEAARLLDEQSGDVGGGFGVRGASTRIYGNGDGFTAATGEAVGFGDSGGASRFFYCAKAARAEKEAGLDGLGRKPGKTAHAHGSGEANKRMGRTAEEAVRPLPSVRNHHPTVKPVDLMRWLIRMVAKPGQTVLDPFMGSGTTGVAATLEGVHFTGIEREADYLDIAHLRIANTQPSLFGDAA